MADVSSPAPQKWKKKDQQIEDLKVAPHSIEAEQSVLGGIILNNKAWDDIVEKVGVEDFYRYEHRIIFQVMADLVEKDTQSIDTTTLTAALSSINELENIGGEVYLFELSRNTPSAANIKAYADIVRERSVLRQLIGAANAIADTAYNPEGRTPTDLLDIAEQQVFKIAEQGARGDGPQAIKGFLTKALDRIDKLSTSNDPITGLATGFTDFDHMTSGLQPADLVIVAGRPSMGKTTFAMNIAENAALEAEGPVLVFSLEMPGDALAMRMLSSLSRIDQHCLRTGSLQDDDWPRIASTISVLAEKPLFIDDTAGLSPSEMRARARRLARSQGQLSLIVVDYLQLMQIPGHSENRTNEISEISRSLKALAKELNVPVIALSQLNRSLEQRADRRPMMSDLRESGAIEQDADLIAFVYRDEVYNPDTRDKNIAEIIIGKQRNGPIGKVRLTFQGRYTRFDNFAGNQQFMDD